MSADGDTVRNYLVNDPYARAALARLEAAEEQADEARQLAHRLTEENVDLSAQRDEIKRLAEAENHAAILAAEGWEKCEAQRDALAEALRWVERQPESSIPGAYETLQAIKRRARAALAEAGLE